MIDEQNQNPTQAPAAPPDDETTRLRRENKWSYELVTLVLIVLAVAIYFILSGGFNRSGTADLDGNVNQPIIPSNTTTQPVVSPSGNANGGVSNGTLD